MKRPLFFTTLLLFLLSSYDGYSQAKVPRFESTPCPTYPVAIPPEIKPECGSLIVAQDRSKPNGKTFRLAVVILRAVPSSTAPPLVFIHGGPSGPGGIEGPESIRALDWVPQLKRDIIIYDQRGAGMSEPRLCPDAFAQAERVLQGATEKEREEIGSAQTRECIASLRANGIDPDMFGSEFNAYDLTDLRKVLGISKWDLLGVSYGARMVQEMLRRDPAGIRSVVMHSPSSIAARSHSDAAVTRQRLMEHIFAKCRAQAECASKFPTFEKDFYAVYHELGQNPIDITVEDVRGPIKIRLDSFRFIRTATNLMNLNVAKLPLLIKEFRNGDRVRAAQYLVGRRVGGGVGNNSLTELVNCYDGYGTVYAQRVAEVRKMVRPEFLSFVNSMEQCPSWHTSYAPVKDQQLVRSDVPALVLTAEFDDRTPTEHGKRIASALKNSYHFELLGMVHGNGLGEGCGESLVLQFLSDPNRKPDASCLASMPRTKFELKTLEAPTVYFNVAGADGKLTGLWGAYYPAIETPVRFELKAAGNVLTGSYRATGQQFEIFEGTIGVDTVSFKIRSPLGDRTITFTGKLSGDDLVFQRDVVIRPGGRAGGAFLWGAGGPKSFTATRVVAEH